MTPQEVLFDKEKGTLLLTINKADLTIPEFIKERAEDLHLAEKAEMHVTIIGFSVGRKIKEELKEEDLNNLGNLIKETNWKITLKSNFYQIEKDYQTRDGLEKRQSIIVMADVIDLGEFIKKVNELLSFKLEEPPIHITLFTRSSISKNMQSGIGIATKEDFNKLNPIPIIEYND